MGRNSGLFLCHKPSFLGQEIKKRKMRAGGIVKGEGGRYGGVLVTMSSIRGIATEARRRWSKGGGIRDQASLGFNGSYGSGPMWGRVRVIGEPSNESEAWF
ncbi:hypothetical protein NE237_026773 [Protea cynaroides]|uniref:Uncharacterized protein n=1 Tax=Protea cynaroides TaxID=273540 RepID=A0A9Q0GNY7_9MAGN|nr:hypothetical protein NE237_026773 [Protea cynaroides]